MNDPARPLLERPDLYRLTATDGASAARSGTRSIELEVGRSWVALRADPVPEPGASTVPGLEAAGFRPPEPDGRSPSTRAWFRSWALPSTEARLAEEADVRAAARTALGLAPDGVLDVVARPSRSLRDRALPIVPVLLGVYGVMAVLGGWIVLFAWDALLPARAHPQAALWAQVVAPIVTAVALIGYAVGIPELRLRTVVAKRPPTAAEVDRQMPGTAILGYVASPIVLVALLVIAPR